MNLHVVNLFSFPSSPFTTLSGRNMYKIINPTARLAWENSGHLVMLSTTGFPIKWSLTNTHRNSMMKCHYPDLGSSSDWLNQISHAARPIRSTTQIWVVTRHQYGISELVSQTSFGGETSGGIAKCRLFSQATARLHKCILLLEIWEMAI